MLTVQFHASIGDAALNKIRSIVLIGLLIGGGCFAQTKPQRHLETKEQQAEQAEEASRGKALAAAKTAALVVRATTTVACPGGAPGDCIRTDNNLISQIQSLVEKTEIWDHFEKVDATRADIILQFDVRDSSTAIFTVRDADSNEILYTENRRVVSLDNDVNRIIAHFLLRAPKQTEAQQADSQHRRRCAATVALFNTTQALYSEKLQDYTWKNSHVDDAIMNECEIHWKDFVCLEHGKGTYYTNWNESAQEFSRKLRLEYEEVNGLEKQIQAIRSAATENSCTLPSSN